MKKKRPEFAVDRIRFLLDLPPAERSLIFCARGGRRIRLDRSQVMELTLTLDGPWSEDEKARISDLLALPQQGDRVALEIGLQPVNNHACLACSQRSASFSSWSPWSGS